MGMINIKNYDILLQSRMFTFWPKLTRNYFVVESSKMFRLGVYSQAYGWQTVFFYTEVCLLLKDFHSSNVFQGKTLDLYFRKC